MKKAFSLIELLIASTIFALIMVVVTATFGLSSSYSGKLIQMRRVSQQSRETIDMLSRDIRQANGSIDMVVKAGDTSVKVGEITLLNCTGDSSGFNPYMTKNCVLNSSSGITESTLYVNRLESVVGSPSEYVYTSSRTANNANALLILRRNHDKAIMYRALKNNLEDPDANYRLVRKEIDININLINLDNNFGNPYENNNYKDIDDPINSWAVAGEKSVSTKVCFSGYAPGKNLLLKKQQPYVEIWARMQTWDYETSAKTSRYQNDSQTTVETRDYNL